jgi:O-acetyl-ADP-ribose deacetylase (regulator of RNase III)
MITYLSGNLFDSKVQVLTNAVNCVGVMGKSVALEFKNRYPAMHAAYVKRCDKGEMKIGEPWLWENDSVQVLNFPTKQHWRNPSSLESIELGLMWLVSKYSEVGIYTIAMPALGCGNGGLSWADVEPMMQKHLDGLSDLEVFIYPPRVGVVSSGLERDDSPKHYVGKPEKAVAAEI